MRQLRAAGPALDDRALARRYDDTAAARNCLRLNMIGTLDGAAAGPDGRTGSINTPPDNRVFALLRAWCDVILVGSGTALAEGYAAPRTDPRWEFVRAGRPSHPPMAVLTGTGRVPAAIDRPQDAGPVFAVGSPGGRSAPVVEQLRAQGHHRILCEGGPRVAGQVLAEGLADELCLTLAPTTLVGDAGRIATGDARRTDWRLVDALVQDGTLLTRWRAS